MSSHDIERSLDDLFVDVGNVDGDESDGHEENTDEKHDENGEVFGIGEGKRPVPVEKIFSEKYIGTGNKREGGNENTDIPSHFQWKERE